MRAFAAVALIALAGCVSQPTGVQAQFEAFAGNAATADIMAGICPQYQMRNSIEQLTEGFVDQMLASGYSELDVLQAIQNTPEDRIIEDVISEMGRQGVTPGDAAALCAYAEREVAAGSQIGRFLR
ncbi:DUF5333 family protein [Gymnodinialimonas hymeniacidonis]|uniref:DUF5333 family protein n=1 Tax=Gymnodinialimonas hymeniacidonis TaxID=3126508 RepID=UPI0034C640C5